MTWLVKYVIINLCNPLICRKNFACNPQKGGKYAGVYIGKTATRSSDGCNLLYCCYHHRYSLVGSSHSGWAELGRSNIPHRLVHIRLLSANLSNWHFYSITRLMGWHWNTCHLARGLNSSCNSKKSSKCLLLKRKTFYSLCL